MNCFRDIMIIFYFISLNLMMTRNLEKNINFWKMSAGKFVRNRFLKDPFFFFLLKIMILENFYPDTKKFFKFLKIKKQSYYQRLFCRVFI